MFRQAAKARGKLEHNLALVGIDTNIEIKKNLKKAVKRDLQAQRLRPNVPVPSRRAVLPYLKTMRAETGSWWQAFQSLLHSGSWTSSGGSFRLASEVGQDLPKLCDAILNRRGKLKFLEIGAGWAGFVPVSGKHPDGVAYLAQRYEDRLAHDVELHFTNLTRWFDTEKFAPGIVEHPYVAAAGLSALALNGIPFQSVDIIYSQAAAYFELNQDSFITSASKLLRPNGILIYNHSEKDTEIVNKAAKENDLHLVSRIQKGGMNGDIVLMQKMLSINASHSYRDQVIPPFLEEH